MRARNLLIGGLFSLSLHAGLGAYAILGASPGFRVGAENSGLPIRLTVSWVDPASGYLLKAGPQMASPNQTDLLESEAAPAHSEGIPETRVPFTPAAKQDRSSALPSSMAAPRPDATRVRAVRLPYQDSAGTGNEAGTVNLVGTVNLPGTLAGAQDESDSSLWTSSNPRLKILALREPNYPEIARRNGIEGRVLLSVVVQNSSATRAEVRVLQSSGSKWLDQAAAQALQDARFELLSGAEREQRLIAFRFSLAK
jgi:TonB family protein